MSVAVQERPRGSGARNRESLMTFPFYLELGPFSLHPHWAFETLAYSVGFYLYRRHRRQYGDVIDARTRWWIIGAAVLGGLVGSRLLALLENPVVLAERWADPVFLASGKTIVGALIGGLIGVEWIKRRLGVVVATGDLLVVPLALGIAVGRIGCFLSGLVDRTHGVASTLPWAIDFGDGVRRHPTQLYEMAFLCVFVVILQAVAPRLAVPGDRFKVFMLAYLTFRLAIEFIKPAPLVGGLSMIQWASLATIVYYLPHVPRLLSEVRHG